ncbi:hypothetical protein JKP88DRAFT_283496 [Tribonema minus]|uniref:Uncharacterized protein n=1 Tax=Tribonema minus TaxID=303371 RepID=A0A835YHE1_9STRA|nr:hypothetical protein JKP88DRAFT_283496 [Tribonema minus]
MVRRGGTVLAGLALVQAASGTGVLLPPGQAAGAVVAPTVPPTSVGLMDFFQQPADLRCLQLVGDQFSVTVRFCLRRPRRWHLVRMARLTRPCLTFALLDMSPTIDALILNAIVLTLSPPTPLLPPLRASIQTFALLDMKTKEYYMGNGASIAAEQESQCGEVTFTQALSTPPGARDLMWKFYIVPTWGTATDYVEDTFPNMLAEAGVPEQPDYMRPLPPAALCKESAPNPRLWSFPPTGLQNAIDYAVVPPCLTPGTTWALAVRTHLETQARGDLHCNLQLGSGADNPDDVYLTETDVWGREANSVAASWSALPPGYWTLHDIVFTPTQTRMVRPGAPVYVVCSRVPAGASFGEDVPHCCRVRPGAPVYVVCFLVPAGASFGEDVPHCWRVRPGAPVYVVCFLVSAGASFGEDVPRCVASAAAPAVDAHICLTRVTSMRRGNAAYQRARRGEDVPHCWRVRPGAPVYVVCFLVSAGASFGEDVPRCVASAAAPAVDAHICLTRVTSMRRGNAAYQRARRGEDVPHCWRVRPGAPVYVVCFLVSAGASFGEDVPRCVASAAAPAVDAHICLTRVTSMRRGNAAYQRARRGEDVPHCWRVRPGAPVYVVCFLVSAGASFGEDVPRCVASAAAPAVDAHICLTRVTSMRRGNAAYQRARRGEDVPGTWTLLDREFFTSVQFCPAALPAAAAAAVPASAAPAATAAAAAATATATVAPAAAAAAAAATAASAAPLPAVPPRLRSGQRRVVEVSASSDQQQL